MLSRIADSLFWLNRYMERADGLLRVARTHYITSLDTGINIPSNWQPVLNVFTYLDDDKVTEMENNSAASLAYLMLDTGNINSLKIMLTKARENARGVQDHITKEVWENVNQLYRSINMYALKESFTDDQVIQAIDDLTRQCILYTGVTDITMPRGIGWSFMNLGRYIERCLQTLEITEVHFKSIEYSLTQSLDIMRWRILLLSLSGYELHLKTYQSSSHTKNVLHQTLLNKEFPHSVIYCLERVKKYLDDILIENNNNDTQALARAFGRLYSTVEFAEFDTLNDINLHEFLLALKTGLLDFSSKLAQNFFSYS
jgi:uncharacterized alpha-E superfamily protein